VEQVFQLLWMKMHAMRQQAAENAVVVVV